MLQKGKICCLHISSQIEKDNSGGGVTTKDVGILMERRNETVISHKHIEH